jgi:hypothetical protein
MADKNYMELAGETFEPYDPNKPLFTWKPDWSRTKEYLKSIIPGANAVDFYANNPDAPISETLSLLAEDFVPFYGNIKNGGDASDFITEAALLAMPSMKARKRLASKNDVYARTDGYRNNPNDKFLGSRDMSEYLAEDVNPKSEYFEADSRYDNDTKKLLKPPEMRGLDPENTYIMSDYKKLTPDERKALIQEIDNSIAAHDKVPKRGDIVNTIDYNGKTFTEQEFFEKYMDIDNQIRKLEKKRSLTNKDANKLIDLKKERKKMDIADALTEHDNPTVPRNGLSPWDAHDNITKNKESFYGPYLEDMLEGTDPSQSWYDLSDSKVYR